MLRQQQLYGPPRYLWLKILTTFINVCPINRTDNLLALLLIILIKLVLVSFKPILRYFLNFIPEQVLQVNKKMALMKKTVFGPLTRTNGRNTTLEDFLKAGRAVLLYGFMSQSHFAKPALTFSFVPSLLSLISLRSKLLLQFEYRPIISSISSTNMAFR